MRIRIVAVGQKPPKWVKDAVDDYNHRFPPEVKLTWHEVKAATRGASQIPAKWMQIEAQAIEQVLPPRCHIVALDEHGDDLTTRGLAHRMERWRGSGVETAIIIGGPDGLDASIKQKAAETIRLSSLTLPHAMVRVLLIEQLFRGWSVMHNHPYHRD